MNEKDIIPRLKRFDEQALAEVYDRFSASLYAYAYRLLGDPQQAEDCVGETFLRLLGALQVGRGPEQYLQAYLYRIAHNWITDQYRRQPLPSLPLDDRLTSGEDGPESLAARRIVQSKVRSALRHLTPDQRQVILLKYVEGWSNDEVAAALQKPAGAIKSLQHRALERLRSMMVAEEELVYEPVA